MTQEIRKANTNNEHYINKEDLTAEIGEMLKDFFVGTVTEEEEGLTMAFLNGQKFRLSVSEL